MSDIQQPDRQLESHASMAINLACLVRTGTTWKRESHKSRAAFQPSVIAIDGPERRRPFDFGEPWVRLSKEMNRQVLTAMPLTLHQTRQFIPQKGLYPIYCRGERLHLFRILIPGPHQGMSVNSYFKW